MVGPPGRQGVPAVAVPDPGLAELPAVQRRLLPDVRDVGAPDWQVPTVTAEQVGVNAKAVLAAAARLEARGWQGPDAAAFVEGLLLEAIRSGYRPLDPPPALRGTSSTTEGRARAKALFEETMREKAK